MIRLGTTPVRWLMGRERDGRLALLPSICDLLLIAIAAKVANGYGFGHPWSWPAAFAIGAVVAPFFLLGGANSGTWPRPGWSWLVGKFALASILALTVAPGVLSGIGVSLRTSEMALILALTAPLQCLARINLYRRDGVLAEPLRYCLAGLAGVVMAAPFLTNRMVGTADAYWYAGMVADFVSQLRAGVFPIFAGQTDFAFNGTVSPVRYAPYLQHAAGLLDILTGRSLTFFGLLNLTMAASLVAGSLATYICLVRINPSTRWIALGVAYLYASSPALLSLAYTGDLFMSVCTAPYIPLVLYCLHRNLELRTVGSMVRLAAAVAILWWCHAPIAFWVSGVVALGQLLRIGSPRGWPGLGREWVAGLATFAVLAGIIFVSVGTLNLPALVAERMMILENLRGAFPGILLPVSDGATHLSDYQLGWSLWVLLAMALVGTLIRRGRFELILLAGSLGFLALLVPVPGVLDRLWMALPQTVINITFYWPMQRLYLPIAAMIVFAVYVTHAGLLARRRWLQVPAIGLLLVAADWSTNQAGAFLRRGAMNTTAASVSEQSHLPQNRALTRYAYSSFPEVPAYFSHGYIDPVWENRLLDPATFRETDSNYAAIVNRVGTITATEEMAINQIAPQYYVLFTDLAVERGRHYALAFDFRHPAEAGTLVIEGPSIKRDYVLPESGHGMALSGPPRAFGSSGTSQHALPIRVTAEGERLSALFVSAAVMEPGLKDFGRYTLLEYDPERLPVVIESWTPYRARVTSPADAWLETPRIFISGYRASVDGRAVEPRRSPEGLVMIPVSAGTQRAELSYEGPLALRLAYWTALAGWIGLGLSLAIPLIAARRAREAAAPPAAQQ